MIDIKLLQKEIDFVIGKLQKRNVDEKILKQISLLINKRNNKLVELSNKQNHRNKITKEISIKRDNEEEKTALFKIASSKKEKISFLENEINVIQQKIEKILHFIPNLPLDIVPIGNSENQNQIIYENPNLGRGLVKKMIPHYEIGVSKNILDFTRASKLSGSRFVYFKNKGARLIRALENFMLDQHINNGYEEMITPLLVKESALFGTGQFPKFKEDVYKIENEDLYLISTAEISLTNYYNNEIINLEKPKKICGYTPCFRSEAGSAGRDTKGIIRTHQFNKVELVKIVSEEDALEEFEKTIKDAENILELLEIPYRKIILCTGDLGFSSQITYDLELWLPSEQRYREVSSISYFGDFQGRRAKIRYKSPNGKNQFAHTINGSGLAIDRVIAALLEIYQNEDGSIDIPNKLQPYMKDIKQI